MSVQSIVSKVQYTLTEADQTLTVPFYFLADSHLKVILVGETQTVLTISTDYSVTGAGDENGGEVVLTGAATAIGDVVTILRNVPATQLVDYVYNGKFPAATHEQALDKLTMLVQMLIAQDVVGLRFEDGETLDGTLLKSARSGKVFLFDEAGVPVFITASALVQDGVDGAAEAAADAQGFRDEAAISRNEAEAFKNTASAAVTAANASAVAAAASEANAAVTLAGAVAKSGSTMTGALTLSGNAVNALHAVPKQQAESITNARAGDAGGLSFRNRIINGNGSVNQRAYVSGTATVGANQYTLDRWRVVTSGQNLTFSTAGITTTMTAPAGGVEQVIEGGWNDGGAHVISWTGTATCTVNGVAKASGANFTVAAGSDITVKFSSGTFTNVQVESGTVATPFEIRPPGVTLALCQRYYQTGAFLWSGYTVSPNVYSAWAELPVVMRAAPTVVLANTNATNFAAVSGTAVAAVGYIRENRTSTGTGAANFGSTFTASAEL